MQKSDYSRLEEKIVNLRKELNIMILLQILASDERTAVHIPELADTFKNQLSKIEKA